MNAFRNLLLLITFILLAQPAPVSAGISFSVSPIRMELNGEPGGSHSDAIEVRNEGADQVRIRIVMEDWYISETGTPTFQKAGSQQRSCAAWMKINPVDFLLQPGEKKVVRYSVTIPADTPPGGYWGAFIFETVPIVKPGQKASAVALKGNIASIVYVTAGKPAVSGEIIDMSHAVDKEGQTLFTRLQNVGTVPFRIKGDLKVVDAQGQTVRSLPFPDAPVLAGYARTFDLRIEDPLPPGKYVAQATVDIGAIHLLAGEIAFSIE